jgi:hypothetical protein
MSRPFYQIYIYSSYKPILLQKLVPGTLPQRTPSISKGAACRRSGQDDREYPVPEPDAQQGRSPVAVGRNKQL